MAGHRKQSEHLPRADRVGSLRDAAHRRPVRSEQERFLVQRRGAPQVLEERRVVDIGDLALAERQVSADLGREHGGADRFLGLLAHRQIGGERERREQVGESKLLGHDPPPRSIDQDGTVRVGGPPDEDG